MFLQKRWLEVGNDDWFFITIEEATQDIGDCYVQPQQVVLKLAASPGMVISTAIAEYRYKVPQDFTGADIFQMAQMIDMFVSDYNPHAERVLQTMDDLETFQTQQERAVRPNAVVVFEQYYKNLYVLIVFHKNFPKAEDNGYTTHVISQAQPGIIAVVKQHVQNQFVDKPQVLFIQDPLRVN